MRHPTPQIATGDAPAPDAPAPAPQQAGQNVGAPNHTVNGSNAQNVTAPTVRGAGSGGSGASGNTAPSSGSRGGSYPGTESEKCIPTEVVVKDSVQSRSTQSPANIPGTLPMVTTADHAAADRATEGHFDVGPVLNGSTLSSAVKDDRFSPPNMCHPFFRIRPRRCCEAEIPGGHGRYCPRGKYRAHDWCYPAGGRAVAGVEYPGSRNFSNRPMDRSP